MRLPAKRALDRRKSNDLRYSALPTQPTYRSVSHLLIAISATAATSAATATRTVFAGTRFVDGQGATLKRFSVQAIDCRLGSIRHFDEAKSPRPVRFAIGDDLSAGDGPEFGKRLSQVFSRCLERKISDVQILHHSHSPSRTVRPPAYRETDCQAFVSTTAR